MPENKRRMHLNTSIDRESESGRYFISCARIRGLGVATLVGRLIDTIAQDQLVTAVLDDDSRRSRLRAGDHKFREDA
jgi:hypothetical protein